MLSTTTIWNVFERENVSSNLLPGELETKDNYLCEAGGAIRHFAPSQLRNGRRDPITNCAKRHESSWGYTTEAR